MKSSLAAELGLPPYRARFPWWGPDLQTLRDEVRALGEALDTKDTPADHSQIGDSLKNIHSMIDNAVDVVIEDTLKAADYAGRIGRMLGL